MQMAITTLIVFIILDSSLRLGSPVDINPKTRIVGLKFSHDPCIRMRMWYALEGTLSGWCSGLAGAEKGSYILEICKELNELLLKKKRYSYRVYGWLVWYMVLYPHKSIIILFATASRPHLRQLMINQQKWKVLQWTLNSHSRFQKSHFLNPIRVVPSIEHFGIFLLASTTLSHEISFLLRNKLQVSIDNDRRPRPSVWTSYDATIIFFAIASLMLICYMIKVLITLQIKN
jgi:hypothetical protein